MRVDLSRLPLGVRRQVDQILREGLNENLMRAIETQRWAAARAYRNPPHAIDGLGPQTMSINSFLDSCFRQMYGADYSQDKERMKWLLKEYPEFSVKSRGTLRSGVGSSGSGCASRATNPEARKFVKCYG